MKPKFRSPVAKLDYRHNKITIQNLRENDFILIHNDLKFSISNALRRFATEKEESNYFCIYDIICLMNKKFSVSKDYYCLQLTIQQARCFVKHFLSKRISGSTHEIFAILDQIVPRMQ